MFEPGHFESMHSYIPLDLTVGFNFFLATLVVLAFVIFRYFLLVGLFYYFYWLKPKDHSPRLLYLVKNKKQQVIYEIKYSLITSVIFSVVGVLIGVFWQKGFTQIYLNFSDYPLWYLPISFLLYAIVHEFYFYFTHRLMHIPKIFKRVHYVHHASLEPSPWASFSFHPWEAILEALILPILIFIIPIHPVVFILYLTIMTLSAIINHLGYELMPKVMYKLQLHRVFVSAEHHAEHHKYFRYNYSLYFAFIDLIFKTEYPNFEQKIKKIMGTSPNISN